MLLDLQLRMRRAVLDGEPGDLPGDIHGDGLDPAARLRIYRNHALTSFGAALRANFPVVCRLVGEAFFAYAVEEYLRVRPPSAKVLAEYGVNFADFLAGFAPCAGLPYLPDTARFEWALLRVAGLPELAPLSAQSLAAIDPPEAIAAVLRLQPALRYLDSAWPVDRIWYANQEATVPAITLGDDAVRLEIRRCDGRVCWRRLEAATYAFRAGLAGGLPLAAAIAAGLRQEPAFDATAALRQVLAEGLATAIETAR